MPSKSKKKKEKEKGKKKNIIWHASTHPHQPIPHTHMSTDLRSIKALLRLHLGSI
jgi:hypothetical protein